jgi:tRNA-binding protein
MALTFEEFLKVDIRVGTVQRSELYAQANQPALKLWIYFGPKIGLKKTSAQITKHYTLEEMVGRQVAAVVNFPPKQIGKFMSEVLILGFPDMQNEVVLLHPSIAVPDGGRLF